MILLDERHAKRNAVFECPQGQIARDPGTVDSTTQNQDIESFPLQPLEIFFAPDIYAFPLTITDCGARFNE